MSRCINPVRFRHQALAVSLRFVVNERLLTFCLSLDGTGEYDGVLIKDFGE